MKLFRSLFRGGARRAQAQNSEPEIEITEDVVAELVAAAENDSSAEVLMLHGDDRVTSKPAPRWYETEEGPPLKDVAEEMQGTAGSPVLEQTTDEAAQPMEQDDPVLSVPDADAPDVAAVVPLAPEEPEFEADPSVRRPRPKKGRVKTRLLGFGDGVDADDAQDLPEQNAVQGQIKNPVGWLVVVDGPGAGEWFTLNGGLASIGRGEDQTVCLDFGDRAISRSNHAALAFDSTGHEFLLGDGGKANSVLVNGVPRSGTSPVVDGDLISIGETTLRLVALCDKTFNWQPKAEGGTNNVGYA